MVNDPYSAAVDHHGSANLVWLASYPKSGNTWVRSVLSAYRLEDPATFALTDLLPAANIVGRQWLSNNLGVPTGYFSAAEVFDELPALLDEAGASSAEVQFIKTHLAFNQADETRSVFAGAYSRRAVFIVRNPLAIAPSLAHHMNLAIDDAVTTMNNPTFGLADDSVGMSTQLPQHIGDWNTYSSSWLDQVVVPVTVVRYEDLMDSPIATMTRVLTECGVAVDPDRLTAAVEATRFSVLAEKEGSVGFRESVVGRPFFRRGESDAWREELTDAQVHQIVANHGVLMARLGYTTSAVA